ncbi:unnamed protein product [Aphanomyces euteiches]|uniref:FYVE-type domain-containing protein n=1 Tax=Aphanomyces euteiches TaxID=100861 RepID=A0A6G0XTV5_9STRA|nr:hypothetical protein Ae201684_001479 [Aphanomyces euteiches]
MLLRALSIESSASNPFLDGGDDMSPSHSFDADDMLIDPRLFVHPNEWVDKSTRSKCLVCVREFNPVWRKKHTCRMCGDVVCNRCSMHKRVDLPLRDNLFRICTWCFLRVRQPIAKAIPVDPALDDEIVPLMEDDQLDTYDVEVVEDFVDPDIEALKLREQELEEEVERSRRKVDELEAKIHAVELDANLTAQQQKDLMEACALIAELQRQLREKEEEHLTTRMTLHEDMRVRRQSLSGNNYHRPPPPLPPLLHTASTDDDSEAAKLRRQLAKMARQMQQAGLNIAEDIPYEEAKHKVVEISKRMEAIGSAEVVHPDKRIQASLRKEYFQLEQEMEKYNTALMTTDEYLAEKAAEERRWHDAHTAANTAALRLVRTCIPVNVSVLSEKQLVAQVGAAPPLARRLKRTNVLELCRVPPGTIRRMHPSIIESYRLSGLGLLERRALHVVLAAPAAEWKKQTQDDLAQRKYAWFKKLREALVMAIAQYDSHLKGVSEDLHACANKHQCPVHHEAKIRDLYAVDLGCPPDDVYFVNEVVKCESSSSSQSDTTAQQDDAITQERLATVKAHYKNQVLQVTQAMGAMTEMDEVREALIHGEVELVRNHKDKERLEALVLRARDALWAMAKRSGICLTGKRDRTKDGPDLRAPIEATVAHELAEYIGDMREEMEVYMLCIDPKHKSVALLQSLEVVLPDVIARNQAKGATSSVQHKRVQWKDIKDDDNEKPPSRQNSTTTAASPSNTAPPTRVNPMKNTAAPPLNFLEELQKKKRTTMPTIAPNDLLAKIRARRQSSQSETSSTCSSERSSSGIASA